MVNARALYAGTIILLVGLVTPAIGQTEAEILLRDSFQTAVANGRSTQGKVQPVESRKGGKAFQLHGVSQNQATVDAKRVKQAILDSWEDVDGPTILRQLATSDPVEYLRLVV